MANTRRLSGPVVVGGEPRIDFLPAETKQGKQNRRQRRSLVALVILVAIVCGLGYTSSTALAVTSQSLLEDEQERTRQLIAQQQTADYAEARSAATDLQTAKDARLFSTANEIMWADYFALVVAELPVGATVTAASMDGSSSIELPPVEALLLRAQGVATMFLTVDVPDLETAQLVMANLPEVPAYADASVALIESDAGVLKMDITLNMSVDALERRFFEAALANPDGEAADEETVDQETVDETDSETEGDQEVDPDVDSGTDPETDAPATEDGL